MIRITILSGSQRLETWKNRIAARLNGFRDDEEGSRIDVIRESFEVVFEDNAI
jgi:hypothetical protein